MSDVKFQLDISGGANVLQDMAKDMIDSTAQKIAGKCRLRSDSAGYKVKWKVHSQVGAPNKHGGVRYYTKVEVQGANSERNKARADRIIERAVASTNVD